MRSYSPCVPVVVVDVVVVVAAAVVAVAAAAGVPVVAVAGVPVVVVVVEIPLVPAGSVCAATSSSSFGSVLAAVRVFLLWLGIILSIRVLLICILKKVLGSSTFYVSGNCSFV